MFLSSALYMFESNVRSATILGIVGAGGIGFQLSDRIRAHRWEEACFILILILVTVAIIDRISKRLRERLIGPATATVG
jgi:phosphonate transport system permease protein